MTRGTPQPCRQPKAELMNLNEKKKKILSLFTSLNSPQPRRIMKGGGGGGARLTFLPQKDNH